MPEENLDFLPITLGVFEGDLPRLPFPFNSSVYELESPSGQARVLTLPLLARYAFIVRVAVLTLGIW